MSEFLFISTLFFYLLSVVGCLLLFLFSRNISFGTSKSIVITHFAIGFVFLLFYLLKFNTPNWIYLSFWCTGILIAGDVARKSFPKIAKAYFLFFLLTVPVFIVSPSRIISLVAGKGFGNPGEGRYRIIDNLYLVKTSEPVDSLGKHKYKLIKEMGFFHKTLARGIPVPDKIDSISIQRNPNSDNIKELLIYHHKNTDTIQIDNFKLAPNRNQITRKPQR
ncbi:MAG: hypothetical protein ACKPB3_11635 [Bacteroidota bacterium]